MALLLITYVSSLMVLEWSNVKILQKPEYVCKASKLCWFQNRNDGFLGFPQLWILLQLQSKKTKNYALLLWLVHWGYISLESATLQAKIMKSKKVQEDEEEGGKKKESGGSFSLKTMILAIADIQWKNAMLLLDFFSYVPKAQEIQQIMVWTPEL